MLLEILMVGCFVTYHVQIWFFWTFHHLLGTSSHTFFPMCTLTVLLAAGLDTRFDSANCLIRSLTSWEIALYNIMLKIYNIKSNIIYPFTLWLLGTSMPHPYIWKCFFALFHWSFDISQLKLSLRYLEFITIKKLDFDKNQSKGK